MKNNRFASAVICAAALVSFAAAANAQYEGRWPAARGSEGSQQTSRGSGWQGKCQEGGLCGAASGQNSASQTAPATVCTQPEGSDKGGNCRSTTEQGSSNSPQANPYTKYCAALEASGEKCPDDIKLRAGEPLPLAQINAQAPSGSAKQYEQRSFAELCALLGNDCTGRVKAMAGGGQDQAPEIPAVTARPAGNPSPAGPAAAPKQGSGACAPVSIETPGHAVRQTGQECAGVKPDHVDAQDHTDK